MHLKNYHYPFETTETSSHRQTRRAYKFEMSVNIVMVHSLQEDVDFVLNHTPFTTITRRCKHTSCTTLTPGSPSLCLSLCHPCYSTATHETSNWRRGGRASDAVEQVRWCRVDRTGAGSSQLLETHLSRANRCRSTADNQHPAHTP